MNLAVFVLIIVYISLCVVLVGGWAFKEMNYQEEKRVKGVKGNTKDNDNDFNQGDLL